VFPAPSGQRAPRGGPVAGDAGIGDTKKLNICDLVPNFGKQERNNSEEPKNSRKGLNFPIFYETTRFLLGPDQELYIHFFATLKMATKKDCLIASSRCDTKLFCKLSPPNHNGCAFPLVGYGLSHLNKFNVASSLKTMMIKYEYD
jgi:hypothetical protein